MSVDALPVWDWATYEVEDIMSHHISLSYIAFSIKQCAKNIKIYRRIRDTIICYT